MLGGESRRRLGAYQTSFGRRALARSLPTGIGDMQLLQYPMACFQHEGVSPIPTCMVLRLF